MPRDVRCQKANCGGFVEARIVTHGRVVYVCASCERKKRRECRDCGNRTPSPWHWRCVTCAKANRRSLGRVRDRARYNKRKAYTLKRWKRRMRDPVFREKRKRYMAAYRQRHPRDAYDRAYGRAYMQLRRADPKYRTRQNLQRRIIREMQREQRKKAS